MLRHSLGLQSRLVSRCASTAGQTRILAHSRNYGSMMSAKEAVQAAKLDKSIKFVDATWYLDKTRSGKKEFLQKRISKATYFDIDEIADKSTDLPHMLPSEEEFAAAMSDMGISSTDHVVVYTNKESFAGPRVWWTFRVFGHKNVSLLQGGLQAWEQEAQGSVESGPVTPATEKGNFHAKLNKKMVADVKQVLDVVHSGSKQIVDARSKERFSGHAPEPRPGLAGGHIPGSLNLPVTEILEKDDFSRFKSPLEVKNAFQNAGIILGSDVITSCGSGVTAAVLFFGLHILGQDMQHLAVYDGSWSEWGARSDLPIYNPAKEEGGTK